MKIMPKKWKEVDEEEPVEDKDPSDEQDSEEDDEF